MNGTPLSVTQQGIWLLAQARPDGDASAVSYATWLDGPLTPAAFSDAWDAVARRHAILGTRVAVDPATLHPMVVSGPPPLLHLADLESDMDASAHALRLGQKLIDEGFDLARGPLARGLLVRVAPQRHLLVVAAHHLVCDGTSLSLLLWELAYLHSNPGAALPPARSYVEPPARGDDLAWWAGTLAGAVDLPWDRPGKSGSAGRFPISLGTDVAAFAAQVGVTRYTVVLAALCAAVHRVTGAEDIVLGTAYARRNRPETRGVVGPVATVVPLRVRVAPSDTFETLVRTVAAVCRGAFAHASMPADELFRRLYPERSLRAGAFSLVLAFQNRTLIRDAYGPWHLEPVRLLPRGGGGAGLTLTVWDDGALSGDAAFDPEAFAETAVQTLVGVWRRLLVVGVVVPSVRLSGLSLVDGVLAERLVGWGWGGSVEVAGLSVVDLVWGQVVRRGGWVAVSDGVRSLSYRELWVRSGGLVVGVESRVGVCLPRSVDLVVALLAVWRAGAAYVPLDPSFPRERLAFMVADAGVRVVVTTAEFVSLLPPGLDVVLLDDLGGGGEVRRGSLAYVMYTSGSTGAPKGVAVEQSAVVRLVQGLDLRPGEGVLHHSSLSFDASVFEIWGALANGCRLVVAPAGQLSISDLVGALAGVSVLWLTAGLFHQVVDEALPGLAGLRMLIAGGDVLSAEHCARVLSALPSLKLVNGYGPTEGTTFTTMHVVTVDDVAGTVPIGSPVPGSWVSVVDQAGHLVPPGVRGELVIGGWGVARGYLGDPALTARRFRPGPDGGRVYHTGDVVRWRTDGVLEFLGRVDDQVKVRGFRVEPGEVSAVAQTHPEVTDVVVLPADDPDGGTRLLGYYTGVATPEALREYLRSRLPSFMVPAVLTRLQRLPLTASGKVDRRALPATDPPPNDAFVAPRTPTEQWMSSLWAQILGVDHIGIHDNFFDLGGHSLMATRVVARLEQALGVRVPLRLLFEHPTVAQLLPQLPTTGAATDPVTPHPRTGQPIPASFGQQRLWFLTQLDPQAETAYHIAGGLHIHGNLNIDQLHTALNTIIARHESLRTTLSMTDGQLTQTIHPTTHLPLPLLDLTNQPKTQQEQSFRALASEPFDLSRTPLLRAALVKLGSDEYVFLVTVHHVVADGWSVGVLIRELGVCYSALGGGVEPDLPVLSVQYADYSLWLREWLDGGRSRASLAWWVERLAGVVPLELPTDRPRPLVQRYRGAQWVGEVSGELFAAVEGCAAGVRATPFMVLLAAFDALLARWCGQDDIVVGTPVAGRLRPEVEGLIGFFANSLVLRADCGGDPSFGELVGRVREVCLAAYAHQEVPFERIVEQLHPVRDLTRTPVFQVMFALQNAPAAVLEFPGLRLEPFDVDTGAAKFDLSMMLTPRAGGGLAVTVEYNTDLFDPETVDWLAGAWQRLLAAGVAAPSTRLSGLPLLDERQEARLVEWGRGPVIESDGLTVVDLVGRQAARTPDALAVDGCTYRELEQRASGWALRLRGLGVGAGARVGVCVPRDADLVVALLAVLKTGAAYVPLDPAYPAARIGFMLEDSGAMCVLTTTAFASLVPDDLPRVLMDTPPGETGPVGRVRDDQLAYVIYTSGSTGVPKGVEVEHRALRSFLASMADTTGIGPGDVFAAVTTVSFDIAGLELFLPLTVGAHVVVVPRESTMDGAELSAVIGRHGVTMMQATPAVWQVLLDTQPELPDGFTALCGGDVLTQELAERMPARLVNLYGPTETTIWSTADPGGTSLGRPIANTTVAVVDGHGRPVPVGARGELVIGGRGVARGYLGRPALTAQRFRPDPSASGTRVYHTGDQVRWRPDGTLAFLGRIDNQIKVRGHRVEPGEIETALRTHPTVREAVVVARPDPTGTRLIAYLTGDPDPQQLQTHLREQLPEYMLPNIFVTLDTLPLTPNGKIDRNALPHPQHTPTDPPTPPRNPTEQWIAGIWAELLDTNTISIHDNFFDLGGHSLLAARLVAYARAHFRVDVDLQSFFLTPTIAGLAEFIETAMTRPRSAHNTTVRMRALVNGLSDEVVESLLADPLLDGGLGVRS